MFLILGKAMESLRSYGKVCDDGHISVLQAHLQWVFTHFSHQLEAAQARSNEI